MTKKENPGRFLFLHAIILLYTLASVCAKFASGQAFFSEKFFLFYAFELFLLGIYALLWQQVIKKMALSLAYASRAASVFWAILWSAVIFKERITWNNLAGALIVLAGILIVNGGRETADA